MKVGHKNLHSLPSLERGPQPLPQVAAADPMDFCGILSDEEAQDMIRVIDEEFEQIDED